MGDISLRTLRVQNAKLYKVNIIDKLGFQPTSGINPLEMYPLSLH